MILKTASLKLSTSMLAMSVYYADTGIDVRVHSPLSHDLLSREQHRLLPIQSLEHLPPFTPCHSDGAGDTSHEGGSSLGDLLGIGFQRQFFEMEAPGRGCALESACFTCSPGRTPGSSPCSLAAASTMYYAVLRSTSAAYQRAVQWRDLPGRSLGNRPPETTFRIDLMITPLVSERP